MAFLDTMLLGDSFWHYLLFIIYVVGSFVVAKIFYFITQKFIKVFTQKTKTKLDDIIIDMIEEPIVVFIIILGIHIGWRQLIFDANPTVHLWYGRLLYTAIALNIGWLLARLTESLLKNYITPLVGKTKSTLDDQLLPILTKISAIAIYCIALIMILHNFGLEIGPLLAGLGIGGIAFAFAAKDIISNIFGSATILMDKPFVMGQRVKIGGYDGIVKEVNIRTTKIETLDGTIIYVPNLKFTDGIIENVSEEKARKVKLSIGLSYSTSTKGIEKAIETIKQILADQRGLMKEYTVTFTEFGLYGLTIEIVYWIFDKDKILLLRQEVNLKIKDALEKEHLVLTSALGEHKRSS